MQIAIDGPAGAGKSTVARQVALRLGYLYIDTGAMYRALTYQVILDAVDPNNEEAVYSVLQQLDLRLVPVKQANNVSCCVFIGDNEVTEQIRKPIVSQLVSAVSSHYKVRKEMVKLQQELAKSQDVVMDGRDITTTVLPDAELKIYLNASVEERAKRRLLELKSKGHPVELDDLITQINQRDRLDSTRKVSPLRKAEDAVEIDTTMLTIDQVVERILALAVRRENRV
ncbi:MAG: (d)CMP kinase [Firmicutes bacterium]|nr:(d)CMP kinase [Bacillota bacterium]